MSHTIITITLAVTMLGGHAIVGQRASSAASGEQTSFCEDGPLVPTPLSPAVVTALMNTEQGEQALELARNDGKELDPVKILKGTKVHLSDSRDDLFVVVGSYPMSGADNTWFWIVRQSGATAEILLDTGANCLQVEPGKTLGYKNIVTLWASPAETVTVHYTFDGKFYKVQRRTSRPTER